jgi:hypothetical protein
MNPSPAAVLLLAAVCATAGCQTRVTNYPMLSHRKLELPATEGFQPQETPVDANAGAIVLLKIPLSLRGVGDEISGRSWPGGPRDVAIDNALKKQPGAIALGDARVSETKFSIPFLFGYSNCTVRGRPVTPVNPEAPAPPTTNTAGAVASAVHSHE